MKTIQVPFFRPELREEEVNEVVATLRSGWLTSGPKVKRFEAEFAAALGSTGEGQKGKAKPLHAVALNSGTAALHLAVEALGLKPGQGVLVPTMTFAATAEVVRYQGGIPILVDCDPLTLNLDLDDAERRAQSAKEKGKGPEVTKIVGIMPVHVGGRLLDLDRLERFATAHKLWVVEDSAHAFPAGWQRRDGSWAHRSNGSKSVTCYSFYANKTITTGEGGMAVTSNAKLADRMRLMSLHGLSADAWGRFSTNGNWDYKIVAPGYKYNFTDIAAAIGIHQLSRAEAMRGKRESIARRYCEAFAPVAQIELPPHDDTENRIDSWHLFAVKLRLERLKINRDAFINELKRAGVGCSVHWRPLHLHPYYQKTFGWRAQDFPIASAQWKRLISLPLFPGMLESEIEHVINTVGRICKSHAR
ncbi:MAG: DegT/DnrJ/EryC1/StrS family aminotransferase [Pyrinomonadaceae bacterium]